MGESVENIEGGRGHVEEAVGVVEGVSFGHATVGTSARLRACSRWAMSFSLGRPETMWSQGRVSLYERSR